MMKKHLTIIPILLFTLMFSSTSYAEWTGVSESVDGDNYYVDFDRIRKVDGYVYWLELGDYLKPTKTGRLSVIVYNQGDCKLHLFEPNLYRYKNLSWSFHKEPMGGGVGDIDNESDKEWRYPHPNSTREAILKSVCDWVELNLSNHNIFE